MVEFDILQDLWLYKIPLAGPDLFLIHLSVSGQSKNLWPVGVQVITAEQSQQGQKRSGVTGTVRNHVCSVPQVYFCTLRSRLELSAGPLLDKTSPITS